MAVAASVGLAAGLAYACPAPTITSKPADPTRSTVVRFSFLDSLSGVTFLCSLDGSAYRACSSPTTYDGLAPRRHAFSVKVQNELGGTSTTTSYSWTIDRKPPTIKIGFPHSRWSYSRGGWHAGCRRRRAGVCGTATDPAGVASVHVSIKQNATGRYWNGRRFKAPREVYLRAILSPREPGSRSATRRKWFYPLRLPDPDGAYTLRVRATDKLGNTTRRRAPAKSWFTIDSRAPAVVITSYPPNPSTSPNARFEFSANGPRVSFRCRLDGGRLSRCASPASYLGLVVGQHTFTVVAVDSVGNSSSARYSWQIVSSVPLHVSGDLATSAGTLFPGIAPSTIPVTLTNPNDVPIYVTYVTVSLQSTGAPGCSPGWFAITQASVPQVGIAIRPQSSVTLPAQGATAPAIQLVESGTNQDACQGERLTLAYGGSAHS